MFRKRILPLLLLIASATLLYPSFAQETEKTKKAETADRFSETSLTGFEENPLMPIRVDTPRATMKSFLSAMRDYRKGKETGNARLKARINDAVRTFDLNGTKLGVTSSQNKDAAILLKEVLDRHIVVNLKLVDGSKKNPYWQLKGSDFTIRRVKEGAHEGEYLISSSTIARAREFYEKIKHKPYLAGTGGGALYSESIFQRKFPEWAQNQIVFFPNWQWIGLFLAILLGLIIRVVVAHGTHLLERVTGKFERVGVLNKILTAVDRQTGNIAAAGFWFAMTYALRFEGTAQVLLLVAIQIFASYAVIRAFYGLVDVLTEYVKIWTSRTENTLDDHLVPLVRRSLKIFVVIFGVLVAFQNLGFNVMSVMAGLGLGGLAFALAAQDTVSNLFGSLMILLDRPFQIGDWINVNGMDGTVEDIGFRSTRIRTFYNSEVSIPNSKIANSNIDNYGRRKFRRQVTSLGLTYDTPPEKMEAFLEGVKNIIRANEFTRKDYFHVVFKDYGPSSLDIMIYFFLITPDWSVELVERQRIFLEILRLAHELGVSFAFPTQTLHLESSPDHPAASHDAGDMAKLADTAKGFGKSGKFAKPGGLGIFTAPYKDSV